MCCIVAHCSNIQDLSWCTIPRHLQDTAVPLHPRHYSYSSNYYTGLIITPHYYSPIPQLTTPGSSLSILMASLLHICTNIMTPDPLPHNTRLQNTMPTLFPLFQDTDHPVLVILTDCSICTAQHQQLWFHMATTSRSGPSESTLTQD